MNPRSSCFGGWGPLPSHSLALPPLPMLKELVEHRLHMASSMQSCLDVVSQARIILPTREQRPGPVFFRVRACRRRGSHMTLIVTAGPAASSVPHARGKASGACSDGRAERWLHIV